jgi:cysteine synthase A
VVTIFSDDNKKYLSTGLMKTEPVKEGFLSTDIELKSFRALKRSCIMCCDPAECKEIINPDILQDIKFPTCYVRSLRS